MSKISLKQGKHPRLEPIEEVEIEWSKGINVQRLKALLKKGVNKLSVTEQAIWDEVKDKEDWLYCFKGHIDDKQSVDECYDVTQEIKTTLRAQGIFLWSKNIDRINTETDVKLDFGKVESQTIAKRVEQHFNDEDYLENFRRDALIYFPLEIWKSSEYENRYEGDFIDALETILIKGHKERTINRMGVCNGNKTEDPLLNYPIKKLVNFQGCSAMEKEILVTIEE